jgi:hypothetical protein
MTGHRVVWIALLVLALLTPLGLWLPALLRAGGAWGEWGPDEMRRMIGYVPAGMEKLISLWKAPFPEYALVGWGGAPLAHPVLSYILSALLGIGLCGGTAYLVTRWLTKRNR